MYQWVNCDVNITTGLAQFITEGKHAATDLWALGGLWVLFVQAGMYQRDLEDLEDPYPLGDL